jgi:hypothetical protein
MKKENERQIVVFASELGDRNDDVKKLNLKDVITTENIGTSEKENWKATLLNFKFNENNNILSIISKMEYDDDGERALIEVGLKSSEDGYTKRIVNFNKDGVVINDTIIDSNSKSVISKFYERKENGSFVTQKGLEYTGYLTDYRIVARAHAIAYRAETIANDVSKDLEDTIDLKDITIEANKKLVKENR